MTATPNAKLTAKLYNSLAAFNSVAHWDVLRLPQMRQYLAEHLTQTLAPELPAGFEQKTCVTVACTACGYPYDEAEFTMHFPSREEAVSHVVGDGWDELKDGRVLCMRDDEKHDELRNAIGVIDQDVEDGE